MNSKKNYIVFGLLCVFTLTACEKVIDIQPEFTRERSALFTSLTDYEYALTGTYASLRQTGYFGNGAQTTSSWAMLPDMMTDNLVQTGEDLANWQNQTNWEYSSDEDDILVPWLAAYSVIRQSNIVLSGIDEFAATEPQRVNRIKGQALAIRGMAHFDVLRYWGVQFDRNSGELGIPYVSTEDKEILPARLTVKASYDSIFKDMLSAEALLGNIDGNINTASNRTAIDQTVVRALLARMYLYAKEYASAEAYATSVIDAVPLASMTDFPNIWKDASQAEVIWSISFNAGEGSPSAGAHAAASNRNRFRPTSNLVGLYDQANDIRFSSYFASRQSGTSSVRPILSFATSTRKIINKFIGRGTFTDNVVNWKITRTGEMYLIRAEARSMQGGAQAALGLADLNMLRAARISSYVPEVLSGQALLDAIQIERQKELVGEGHRWFDLKRTTRTISRTDIVNQSTVTTLLPAAREWVWPIPQAEIDANPNLVQNPGY